MAEGTKAGARKPGEARRTEDDERSEDAEKDEPDRARDGTAILRRRVSIRGRVSMQQTGLRARARGKATTQKSPD